MKETAPGTDMLSPVRYVVTALEDARLEGRAVSLAELAAGYDHNGPGDESRFRVYSGADTDTEMWQWVIRDAIRRVAKHVKSDESGYSLVTSMSKIRYPGRRWLKPLRSDSPQRKALYSLRDSRGSIDDLVESMKEHGWRAELGVAIRDTETGIILSGNRRLAAAKKAGVEPRVVELPPRLRFTNDFDRLRFAISANAQKPLTKIERDRAIRALNEIDPTLTQREIGAIVGVSHATVRRAIDDAGTIVPSLPNPPDEAETENEDSPDEKPKADPVPVTRTTSRINLSPEMEHEVARRVLDEGQTMTRVSNDLFNTDKRHVALAIHVAVAKEEGRRESRMGVHDCPLCTCQEEE